MTVQSPYRFLQHIGDNLHPDSALRSAIGSEIGFGAMAHIVEHFDMMGDRIGIGFEQRPPQMRWPMRQAQSQYRAPDIGIMDLRLLAQEIGEDPDTLRARRNGAR